MTGCHVRVRVTRAGEKRYDVRYRRGGRGFRIEHAGTFATKRDAETRRDLVRGWLAAGKDPAAELRMIAARPPARTVSWWADEYLASRVDHAAETRKNSRSHLIPIRRELGALTPEEVTLQHVQAFVSSLAGLKPASVQRYVGTLKQVLDHAGVRPNPARDDRVRLPRIERAEKRIPNRRQIDRMLERIPPRWRLPVRTLAATGARVGELALWTWGDVDLADCRILNRAGKTPTARRWIAVPADLLDEIAATCPPDDRTTDRRLFPGFSADVAKNAISRACKAAGVPHMSPHDLRHRYISVQLARGVPVANVGAQVGHAKLAETLNTYTHVVVDDEDVAHP